MNISDEVFWELLTPRVGASVALISANWWGRGSEIPATRASCLQVSWSHLGERQPLPWVGAHVLPSSAVCAKCHQVIQAWSSCPG